MCDVEESANKGKCTKDLCAVALLERDEPFEIVEGQEVWHPKWKGKIDEKVNAQFVKAAADRIWENEQVSLYILSSGYALTFWIEDPYFSERQG